ncbi:Tyrosine-protein kinase Fer [Dirofilaria immitis]
MPRNLISIICCCLAHERLSLKLLLKNISAMYKEPGLEYAEWYHGLLSRKDINILLTKHGQFLVRETEIKMGEGLQPVLSVKYHMTTKDPITDRSGAMLLYVVTRQNWEVCHEQIELGELLGEGALSAVYRGILKNNGREKEIAVKVRKGHKLDRETVKQICREARIMRKLEHPNIVRLYGIAVSKEPIMLLMELLKDGSLDAFLVAKGLTLDIRKKLYFCLDIASGLEFLHKNRIIHRDISARNCMMENMCVKISDFNLSREVEKQDKNYKMTRLKQNLPIRWLAPETMRNAIYTTKSDVFSYGILLWEVFTNGAEPYCGMTVAEVFINVRDGYRIPSPDTMPKRLQILQQNCFATEISERWSMTQIRKEIEMACSEFQN